MQTNYRSLEINPKNLKQQAKENQLIGQYRTVKVDHRHRSRLENFIQRHSSAPKRKTYDSFISLSKNQIPELDSESEMGTQVIKTSLRELDSKLHYLRDKSIDSKDEEISFSIDPRQFDSVPSRISPTRLSSTPEPNYRTPVKDLKKKTTAMNLSQESNSYSHIMTTKKYLDKLKHLEGLNLQLDKRKKALNTQETAILQKLDELKRKESEFRDRVLGTDKLRDIERMLRYEELEIKNRLEAVIEREAIVEERERNLQELEESDGIRRKLVFDSSILKTPAFSLESSLEAPLNDLYQQDSLNNLEEKLRSTTLDLETRTFELIEKEKSLDQRVRFT